VLTDGDERVLLETRRHGIVLARPLLWVLVLVLVGAEALLLGWPTSAVAPFLLVAAAAVHVRAVTRWERTRLVVTSEKVFVVHGLLRRRAAAVKLRSIDAIQLDQTLAGRVLGYGTLVVGPLEVTHVSKPRRVYGLVERLCG
jgi:hypothetical protein